MTWELICLDDRAQPDRITVDATLDIGRDPHCDLRLLGESGSRYHARLTLIDDGPPQIEDLGSRNGTWLDGRRIERERLDEGRVLRCGEAAFVLARCGEGSQVLSDQGQTVVATVEQVPEAAARPAPAFDALLAQLSALPVSRRPAELCRRAAGLLAGRIGLVRSGAAIAGDLPERLARRLASGQRARLLLLGEHLHGRTIAAAAIGSALVAPLDRHCHLLAVRSLDQDPFTATELARLVDLARLATPLLGESPSDDGDPLLGESPLLQQLRSRIARLAACDATVLITGPSGSGKELVARALHRLSGRASGPFVAVNCAAIAEHLFEAELFGASKGAYTGADQERQGRIRAADGGTLFLDEIGELPLPAQAKLLRVLQEGCVDPVGADQPIAVHVRVLAATNVDLQAAVAAKRFREDLYHRIDVLRIRTPALAEHADDIPLIAARLLGRVATRLGRPALPLSAAALQALRLAAWPGNVRQLENALQRALALAAGPAIEPADLELACHATTPIPVNGAFPTLAELERQHIHAALVEAAGNKTRAAQLLGISRQTLHKKLADFGL
jgi:DNA-binding NtrC family response regulator